MKSLEVILKEMYWTELKLFDIGNLEQSQNEGLCSMLCLALKYTHKKVGESLSSRRLLKFKRMWSPWKTLCLDSSHGLGGDTEENCRAQERHREGQALFRNVTLLNGYCQYSHTNAPIIKRLLRRRITGQSEASLLSSQTHCAPWGSFPRKGG